MAHPPVDEIMQAISHRQDVTDKDQTIYIGIVGFTILVWDHLVTSGDEVRGTGSPGSRAHRAYSVICTVNLVLTIMIIRASDGVKNIAAQLELLSNSDWLTSFHYSLTVTMMSRITLNLKKEACYEPNRFHLQEESIIMSTRNRNHATSTPSRGVVSLNRLRSHTVPSAARAGFGSRARSGSTSSFFPPVQADTFTENPSISATRPHLNAIYFATKTPDGAQSPVDGSPVIEHAEYLSSTSNSNQWNTADVV
ncbi:hypothetical protein BDR03DRAFT_982998 [Suillus americanus]|nr:hypothetical protein BDR03DRAFT_982998 [Suillus americanus]